jgi:hypothetical protein
MRDAINMVPGGSGCSKDWKKASFCHIQGRKWEKGLREWRGGAEEVIVNIDWEIGLP